MPSSPFLDLPREIRNQIYEWVFFPNCVYITPVIQGKAMCQNPNVPSQLLDRGFSVFHKAGTPKALVIPRAQDILGLMLVNHQISAEAATSFYGKFIFRGRPSSQAVLSSFIVGIGRFRRNLIKRIELDDRSGPLRQSILFEFKILELLSTLENLQKLTIKTSVPRVARLQEALILGGIRKLTGRVDIVVRDTLEGRARHPLEHIFSFVNLRTTTWTCAKGQTKWETDTRFEIVFGGLGHRF